MSWRQGRVDRGGGLKGSTIKTREVLPCEGFWAKEWLLYSGCSTCVRRCRTDGLGPTSLASGRWLRSQEVKES